MSWAAVAWGQLVLTLFCGSHSLALAAWQARFLVRQPPGVELCKGTLTEGNASDATHGGGFSI